MPEGHEKNLNTNEIIEKDKNNIKDNVDFKFISEVIDNYKLAIFLGAIILILLILLKKNNWPTNLEKIIKLKINKLIKILE